LTRRVKYVGNKLYSIDDDLPLSRVVDETLLPHRSAPIRFCLTVPTKNSVTNVKLGETPTLNTVLNVKATEEIKSISNRFFAKNEGAVAAPTASLHFSRELMGKRLRLKGVEFAEVTLHVGLGTFSLVEVEDPDQT